jgi:hypothetical protein
MAKILSVLLTSILIASPLAQGRPMRINSDEIDRMRAEGMSEVRAATGELTLLGSLYSVA